MRKREKFNNDEAENVFSTAMNVSQILLGSKHSEYKDGKENVVRFELRLSNPHVT